MQRVFHFIPFFLINLVCSAQVYDYSIGQQLEKIDSVQQYLQTYEDFGYKHSGSNALNNARDWIVSKYSSFGYTGITLDSFTYSGDELQNIIIEKPGLQSDHWIVIGAHYDSYLNSPGANDNGSGVVACLQIAKIMQSIQTQVGIRFIHFSAEEDGLVGSQHYVDNSMNPNDVIELVLNLDQLGGTAGSNNATIVCERDEDMNPSFNNAMSSLKTDTLAQLARIYGQLNTIISNAYGSDYMPFQDSGFVITGLFQESSYPFYHDPNDKVINMDVGATQKVIQAALAAAMYFSRNTLPLSVEVPSNQMVFYPNPAEGSIQFIDDIGGNFKVNIYNTLGELVLTESLHNGGKLGLHLLTNGSYSVRIITSDGARIIYSKLIIAR
ncbi:MAG: M28 family peptidase [Bacteroidia bacterium]